MSNLIRELTVDGVVARGCVAVSDDEPEESLLDSEDRIDIVALRNRKKNRPMSRM